MSTAWKDAKQHKPPVGKVVLVAFSGMGHEPDQVSLGYYARELVYRGLPFVTHWMELPKLPKVKVKVKVKKLGTLITAASRRSARLSQSATKNSAQGSSPGGGVTVT